MQLIKHTIQGKKGVTVCYTIPNFRFDDDAKQLKWDAFRFHTPEGDKKDADGFQYFDVPADYVPIQRDDQLNKQLLVITTLKKGVEALEIYQGATPEPITIGLEGDIIATGIIPSDPNRDIIIDYKEVTDA